jgi:hypothetical protein
MSAPSPGQLRPNSAIYLGSGAVPSDDLQSTPPTSPNSPLLSPGGTRRIPHLPSPPHTSSTSGSAGEREKEGGSHTAEGNVVVAGIRSKQRVTLPAVVIMQNEEQDLHHGFDNDPKRIYHQQQHFEQDKEVDRTARIQPKRSLAEKNKEVRLYRVTLDYLSDYLLTIHIFLGDFSPFFGSLALRLHKSHDHFRPL